MLMPESSRKLTGNLYNEGDENESLLAVNLSHEA
jgi:hypothetical protein